MATRVRDERPGFLQHFAAQTDERRAPCQQQERMTRQPRPGLRRISTPAGRRWSGQGHRCAESRRGRVGRRRQSVIRLHGSHDPVVII